MELVVMVVAGVAVSFAQQLVRPPVGGAGDHDTGLVGEEDGQGAAEHRLDIAELHDGRGNAAGSRTKAAASESGEWASGRVCAWGREYNEARDDRSLA